MKGTNRIQFAARLVLGAFVFSSMLFAYSNCGGSLKSAGGGASSSSLSVAGLTLAPASATIHVNTSLRLIPSGDGSEQLSFILVSGGGSVDETGLYIAPNSATTAVVGLSDGVNTLAFANITVVGTPGSLALEPSQMHLGVGDTTPLAVTGGRPPYTFSMAPQGLATINSAANMTATAVGQTVVTVTDADGTQASTTVSIFVHGKKVVAYSGAPDIFVVPAGVVVLTIKAWGGGGGAGGSDGGASAAGVGGGGAFSSNMIPVISGETLNVVVGGAGGGGVAASLLPGQGPGRAGFGGGGPGGGSAQQFTNGSAGGGAGGGGGGATIISRGTTSPLIVAGGGGGGGGAGKTYSGGNGGGGGKDGTSAPNGGSGGLAGKSSSAVGGEGGITAPYDGGGGGGGGGGIKSIFDLTSGGGGLGGVQGYSSVQDAPSSGGGGGGGGMSVGASSPGSAPGPGNPGDPGDPDRAGAGQGGASPQADGTNGIMIISW